MNYNNNINALVLESFASFTMDNNAKSSPGSNLQQKNKQGEYVQQRKAQKPIGSFKKPSFGVNSYSKTRFY